MLCFYRILVDAFINFIKEWGYVAVFLGSLIEGESIILTSSSLAYFGYLNLYKIMMVAFVGTVIADQLLYMVGRKYGENLLLKYPKFQDRFDRAARLLHRFDVWFILSFRFIYGIRIISPVVIGALKVEPKRFIPLNIIAAVVWTIVSCTGGYYFGEFIFNVLHNIQSVQKYIFISLAFVLLFIGLKKYIKRKNYPLKE